MRSFLIIVGSILLVAGCHSRVNVGSSTSEIIPPPEPPQIAAKPDAKITLSEERIDYVNARAKEPVPKPGYPLRALAAHGGDYSLYLTLTVNEDGTIGDIHPTLGRVQLPNPYFDDFVAAAQAALIHWHVDAPRKVYWRKAANGEMRYERTETDSTTIDLKISFTESHSR